LLSPRLVNARALIDYTRKGARLEACKRFGWRSIPATVVDLKEIVKGEFAENAMRKDFPPSEVEAIRRA
jgi:ParB family transcriptional regulator, chromosome partitioning protein